ncbi:two-component sensor histidine kinase [Paucibacter sp. KBW04]|uniref:HAMP domain-containing sensor histidine kinase n=1 Tax=Paucibacter sp. KBW04 TaxID=2153361 RepID=UPI000F586D64|nr:ATP-binding protein [Paucibacter sp. KBW04]RQO57952.1 two-component sensor histidine kinase [Paucibacter sp. KBW04]
MKTKRLRHRLGARMVLVFVLLAALSSLILVGGVRQLLDQGWRSWVQPLMSDYVDRVVQDLGSPPQIERARALTQRLPLEVSIRGPVVNWSSQQERAEGAPQAPKFDPWQSRHNAWAEQLSRRSADGHEVRIGLSRLAWNQHPSRKAWWMLAGLLLVTALAYASVRWMLRPLQAMAQGAEAFGRGEFDHRIPIRQGLKGPRHLDELGDLALRFNQMAADIQQMLDGKRALLLAISHELRSPLTRARLNAELVEPGQAQQAMLHDLGLMAELINDLLESERLGAGHKALQLQAVNLNALAREAVGRQSTAVELDLAKELPLLQLDPMRIQLLLRNLLDNAARHHRPELGPVQLSTRISAQGIELRLRDQGPGVAPELLSQLGQPFYRTDAARSRSEGGAGLGLSLCRLIALAHGGQLSFANAEPGLAVSLVLPTSFTPIQ